MLCWCKLGNDDAGRNSPFEFLLQCGVASLFVGKLFLTLEFTSEVVVTRDGVMMIMLRICSCWDPCLIFELATSFCKTCGE